MSKIVVSIALIHKRLPNVTKIVNGFLNGDVVPDKIYFFISEEPFFLDEGIKPEEIPKIKDNRVEFVYVPNIGPIRKWMPILKMYWDEQDTKIITFDDDREPHVDTVSTLVAQSDRYPECAIGFAGPNLSIKNPFSIGARKTNLGWGRMNKPVNVSFLSSGVGCLVKPRFFKEDVFEWEQYEERLGLRKTDEVYIAYHLAKNGHQRKVVPVLIRVQQILEDGRKGTGKIKRAQLEEWHTIIGNYHYDNSNSSKL